MVLLALADGADADSGETWPSQRRIAERARLTPRGVRLVLARLEADGWLVRERRTRANGSTASTLYRLDVARLDPARAAYREAKEAKRAEAAQIATATGGNPVPTGGNAVPMGEEQSAAHVGERGSPLETSNKKQEARGEAQREPKPRRSLLDSSGGASALPEQQSDTARRLAGRQGVDASRLTPFQRAQIAKGAAFVLDGELLRPTGALYGQLLSELQAERLQ